MNMKDVKELAIPDGRVVKIENSDGDVMWGSQSAFPYRRLEYVICNGSAACDTGITASTAAGNAVTKFITKIKTGSNVTTQQRVIANYTAGATYSRMYALVVNTKLQNVIGGSWGDGPAASTNTEYTIESSMYYNDRYIIVNGTKTQFGYMNSYTATSGNTYGIGGCVHQGNTPIFETGFTGYIYDIDMVSQNGNRHFYFIPVQRKSDNKVGFLRFSVFNGVNNNDYEFLPSTWLSEFGAGPVVDEYFDTNELYIPGSGWNTLWEGNCELESSNGTQYYNKMFLCRTKTWIRAQAPHPVLRITFTNLTLEPSDNVDYDAWYVVDGSRTSTAPTSPASIQSTNWVLGGNTEILGAKIRLGVGGTELRYAGLESLGGYNYDTISAINLNHLASSDPSVCGITITKIEQYC